MRYLLFFLAHCSNKRVALKIGCEFPALGMLLWVVAGQALGGTTGTVTSAPWFAAAFLGTVGAVSACGFRRSAGRLTALGLGLVAVSMSEGRPFSVSPDRPVWVRAESPPAHRRNGALDIRAGIYEMGSGIRLGSADLRAAFVPWRNIYRVRAGSEFAASLLCRPLQRSSHPFTFDASRLRRGLGASCTASNVTPPLGSGAGFWDAARDELRWRVEAILGQNERAGVLLSMSFGTRDVLTRELETSFQRTGMTHLLVVSGFQVTLVFGAVFCLGNLCAPLGARLIRWYREAILGLSLGAACCYALLVGMEPSSIRAAVALAFVVSAKLVERGEGFVHTIVVSLLILSLLWPGCVFEPGTQLTYAALFAIALAERGPERSRIGQAMRITYLTFLGTSSVCAIWFDAISFGGLVLNLLAAPVLSVVGSMCGIAASALAFVPLGGVEKVPLHAVAWVLWQLVELIRRAADIPGIFLELEGGAKWVVCAMLAGLFLYAWLKRAVLYFVEFGYVGAFGRAGATRPIASGAGHPPKGN